MWLLQRIQAKRGIGAACDCDSGFRVQLSLSPTYEGIVLKTEENKCLSSHTLTVFACLCPYLQYKINKKVPKILLNALLVTG